MLATTNIPAKNNLIFFSGMRCLIKETITIDVVKFSSITERKNVIQQITHSNVRGFSRSDLLRYEPKPRMRIDQFNGRHRAKEKKQNLGDRSQVVR